MKQLLESLLLMALCARWSHSVSYEGPLVFQPPHVFASEGETVNISCCWTRDFIRVKVGWEKNQREITDKQRIYLNEAKRCSDLVLTNVTQQHSGRYICKLVIEIPSLIETEGNGTIVTVTAKNDTKDNSTGDFLDKISFIMRSLPIIALFTAFFCLNCFWNKAQKQKQAAPDVKTTSAQQGDNEKNEVEMEELRME